jgi:hypothetical protein
MYRATRASSDASGDAGPQIVIRDSDRKQGGKNISPWMWSRWRWVSRMLIFGIVAARANPRVRIPVPASRITVSPSESVTWTHEVLPP